MTTNRLPQLTAAQVGQLFGVSHMTIYSWRKGTKTMEPLPQATPRKESAKPVLRFNVSAVLKWAKKQGLPVIKTPEQVIASEVGQASKPGPKPRSKVAA